MGKIVASFIVGFALAVSLSFMGVLNSQFTVRIDVNSAEADKLQVLVAKGEQGPTEILNANTALTCKAVGDCLIEFKSPKGKSSD